MYFTFILFKQAKLNLVFTLFVIFLFFGCSLSVPEPNELGCMENERIGEKAVCTKCPEFQIRATNDKKKCEEKKCSTDSFTD